MLAEAIYLTKQCMPWNMQVFCILMSHITSSLTIIRVFYPLLRYPGAILYIRDLFPRRCAHIHITESVRQLESCVQSE